MNITLTTKYRDEIYDFRTSDTKQYTHCFHSYPAMMIPQVAERILSEYGKDARLLFDPYCGTGTSLVEANLKGIESIGTDINPLARLIAKVKTTVINLVDLDYYLRDFSSFILSVNLGAKISNVSIPYFKNIDYWFKKETQLSLAIIKDYIKNIDNPDIRDFFYCAFSETVRDVSLTRNSEFKLYRMKHNKIQEFNPDVLSVMVQKLVRNRNGMKEYIALKRNNSKALIYDFNTVYRIPESIIQLGSVDIVITSPPYGDSRTTVAYGQFSRLANQWLGFEEMNEVDTRSMGGGRFKEFKKFGFEMLDCALKEIAKKDNKRGYDVISFYVDYEKSINNISKVIKNGGIVAYVVGNRKVKGIQIPNDEITQEFFERNGFGHIKTIIREIPNKRMPKRNSPTNIVGLTDTTMNYEYIVVMKKDE